MKSVLAIALLLIGHRVAAFDVVPSLQEVYREAPTIVIGSIRSHTDAAVGERRVRVAELVVQAVIKRGPEDTFLAPDQVITLVHELDGPGLVDEVWEIRSSRDIGYGETPGDLLLGIAPMAGFRMYALSSEYQPYLEVDAVEPESELEAYLDSLADGAAETREPITPGPPAAR